MQQHMQEHRRRAEQLESLIQEVATFPDMQARATTEELLQTLLDLYGEGLARILELTQRAEAEGSTVAGTLIETFANDELIASLLLLHGLHPLDVATRITHALTELQPYLKKQSSNAELLSIENGIAFLRLTPLSSGCHSCSSTPEMLKSALEEAIYTAAPELEGVHIEDVSEQRTKPGQPVLFMPLRRHNVQKSMRST